MRIYVCLASNVYELVGVKPAAAAVGGEIRDTHTKASKSSNKQIFERAEISRKAQVEVAKWCHHHITLKDKKVPTLLMILLSLAQPN